MKRFTKDPVYYGSIALTWIILACYAFGVAYTQAEGVDEVNSAAEICIAAHYTLLGHYHLVDGANPDEESVQFVREEYQWWIGFYMGFNDTSAKAALSAASDEAQELTNRLKEDKFVVDGAWTDTAMIVLECVELHEQLNQLTK